MCFFLFFLFIWMHRVQRDKKCQMFCCITLQAISWALCCEKDTQFLFFLLLSIYLSLPLYFIDSYFESCYFDCWCLCHIHDDIARLKIQSHISRRQPHSFLCVLLFSSSHFNHFILIRKQIECARVECTFIGMKKSYKIIHHSRYILLK